VLEELKLQVEIAVPPDGTSILKGVQDDVNPLVGLTELEMVTLPLNPETLESVTLDWPDEPVKNTTVLGLEAIVKSGGMNTRTITIAE
jgi:hypothetical protein